jgi:hypothetical protein
MIKYLFNFKLIIIYLISQFNNTVGLKPILINHKKKNREIEREIETVCMNLVHMNQTDHIT